MERTGSMIAIIAAIEECLDAQKNFNEAFAKLADLRRSFGENDITFEQADQFVLAKYAKDSAEKKLNDCKSYVMSMVPQITNPITVGKSYRLIQVHDETSGKWNINILHLKPTH